MELFDEPYEEFEQKMENKVTDCKNILDYYENHYKKKNRLKLFSFELQLKLNGLALEYRDVPIDEYDSLEVEYRFQEVGHQGHERYMDFLHNAYKEDSFICDTFYSGSWNLNNHHNTYNVHNQFSPI